MANTWNESGTTWGTNRWGTTDAISSGWGADLWSTGGSWGQATDELVSLTGVSATVSIGDIISGSNTGWGRAGWSEEPYGESHNPVVTLEGLSATVSLGDAEAFNERGWGRLSWGQADWNEGRDETVSLTGIEATASLGSPTLEFTYLLEMVGAQHSMTASVGSPQVDGEIGVPLTGVSADFATPTLSYTGTLVGWGRDGWNDNYWGESPNQVIPLVGREATASVGSPTLEFAYELSGQEATTNVGSVSFVISPTISLTGEAATVSAGTLGLAFGVSTEPISGVAATSSLGTLGLEFGPSQITGVSATASVGELTTGAIELLDLTGVSATVSVGAISPADVVGLTGVSSTVSVGAITPVDVVQGLTTDQITSSVGIIGIQAYANIDTGSNTSYTGVTTGSNTSYSSVATGSNTSYSDVA